MQNYRVNALDELGHILFVHECKCRNDEEAIAEGKQASEIYPVEIWEGSRLVARFTRRNLTARGSEQGALTVAYDFDLSR